MRADNEFFLEFLGLTISAKGIEAVYAIAVPVALLLAALAWRIAGGRLSSNRSNPPISRPLDSRSKIP